MHVSLMIHTSIRLRARYRPPSRNVTVNGFWTGAPRKTARMVVQLRIRRSSVGIDEK